MIECDNDKDEERIPLHGPWSPTGLDHECGRCGDNITGCMLCAGEKYLIVRTK